MNGLPPRWAVTTFGEVTKIVSGGTPPSKDETNFNATGTGGIPWLTPADLSGYREIYISKGARNLSEKGHAACSAKKIPAGSVLFSSRAPIGYVAIATNEISTNQGFKSFVLPDGINNHFLYYYLKHIKPIAEQMATGTTFKELSGSATAKLPLLVAPLPEQKRIADKLDTVLARVDACRVRLDRLPTLLKRFRQSTLAAATSGRLTKDWRLENIPDAKGGMLVPLGELIADGPQNGLYKHSSAYGTGVGILRIDMFYDGEVTGWDAMKLLEVSHSELVNYGLSIGDIVVNRVNSPPYVGKAALIRALPQPCVFESNMMRIRLDQKRILPEYCIRFLSSLEGLSQLRRNVKHAVNQASINQTDVKSVEVFLPSVVEQHEIVRRVDILLAFADRLEARLTTARKQAAQLTPALLAKAFRGELVAQDPADEPASKLLKRLAAAKDGGTKPARRASPRK